MWNYKLVLIKTLLFFLFYFCAVSYTHSQNLITNGGFETYSTCPDAQTQITYATGWYNANTKPPQAPTADYHNICGYSTGTPNTGDGHASIFWSVTAAATFGDSEGLGTFVSLTGGQTYVFSIALMMNNAFPTPDGVFQLLGVNTASFPAACDANACITAPKEVLGTLSSADLLTTSTGWKTFTFNFTPSISYNAIAIMGDCPRESFFGFVWIDDVSITAACTNSTDPTSITATKVCPGSAYSLTVNGGSLGTGAAWNWYSGSCGGTAEGTGTSINVSPSSNTTYYVRAEGTCNTTSCVSSSISVPFGAGVIWTWTGSQSTNWFDSCNWDRLAIPTSTSDVVIPNTANKPLITAGTGSCKTIEIQANSGAYVVVDGSGGGVLTVAQ